MLSRRALIGKMAVGAAAALAVGAARTGVAATRPLHREPPDDLGNATDAVANATNAPASDGSEQDAEVRTDAAEIASPPPWELVAPFAAGSVVAHGLKLVDLTPVRDGAAVVTLANERGRSHRVHLVRNDGSPEGVVYTRRIDLVVMNQGYGDLPTDEDLGQAVAALAHVVAANEAKVPDRVFAELLPHAARVERFAALEGLPEADGRLR